MLKKIGLIFVLFFLIDCSGRQPIQPIERTKVMMDTFIQISIYDQNRSKPELHEIIDRAFQRIEAIEHITNNYDDSSFISMINREAAKRAMVLDSVMDDLIQESDRINKLSHGAFDITLGSIKPLWNFSEDDPRIPGDSLLRGQLRWVGANHLRFEDHRLQFDSPQVKIDLGGIAKGYAVDQAIEVLKKHGVTDAMVNAGGNLRAICSDLTRGERRVWIKHPRQSDALFGYFRMDDGCVATSGDYERYFMFESVRYHHIFDPKTGYPARGCVSVTIKAPTATEADGLSTAVFVLGLGKGLELIERLPDVEAIIIFEEGEKLNWKASSGLKKKFRMR